MSKWKIKHEVFDDTKSDGRIQKPFSDERLLKVKTNTKEDVIKRFKEVHGDTYDYSKVEWVSAVNNPRCVVICKKHGEFEIAVYRHLKGYICPICTKENKNKVSIRVLREMRSKEKFGTKPKIPPSQYDEKEIQKLLSEGVSLLEIGNRLHYAANSLRSYLERSDFYEVSPRPTYGEELTQEIQKLYDQGVSKLQISKKLGIGKSTVFRRLKSDV